MEPAQPSRSAAERKILAFFSEATKTKLAEKNSHPAMRIARTKNGPKLVTYVAQGARKTTGMHILRQGAVQIVMGDALKERDAYFPTSSPQDGRDAGDVAVKYWTVSQPRDVVGTVADIRAWFDEHADELLVIPQTDNRHDDGGMSTKPASESLPVGEGYHGTKTMTAEVRLVSFAKPGDKDYVDLGGVGTAVVAALKQAIGLAATGVGNVFGGEGPGHTAVEAGHAGHGVAEIKEALSREEARGKPGEFKWNRELAAEYLEWAVSLHEGERINRKKFTAGRTWTLAVHELTDANRRRVSWPAVACREVATAVLDELLPELLEQLDDAAG